MGPLDREDIVGVGAGHPWPSHYQQSCQLWWSEAPSPCPPPAPASVNASSLPASHAGQCPPLPPKPCHHCRWAAEPVSVRVPGPEAQASSLCTCWPEEALAELGPTFLSGAPDKWLGVKDPTLCRARRQALGRRDPARGFGVCILMGKGPGAR